MHAVEWKVNALINKDKKLIYKLCGNWRYPLKKKLENYRV